MKSIKNSKEFEKYKKLKNVANLTITNLIKYIDNSEN